MLPLTILSLFGLGVATGLTLGAPFGPTGALCASLVLEGRYRVALVGAAGSACGIATWGVLAMAAAAPLTALLTPWAVALRTVSALIFLAMAVGLWSRTATRQSGTGEGRRGLAPLTGDGKSAFLTCYGVVASNPTGLMLVALLGGPVASIGGPSWAAVVFVPLGIALGGATAFWILLSQLHARRERLTPAHRVRIQRGFAIFVGLLGLGGLVNTLL